MSSTFISDDDKIAAENLIDQLFCDSLAIDLNDEQFTADDSPSSVTPYDVIDITNDAVDDDETVVDDRKDVLGDSGFADYNKMSTSELIMTDGTKVIFVIAPESPESSQIFSNGDAGVSSPASTESSVSPASPEFVASPESEIWSPPQSVRGRRKPFNEKKGSVRKKAKLTVVDKKERKKIQNVEAARRYR